MTQSDSGSSGVRVIAYADDSRQHDLCDALRRLGHDPGPHGVEPEAVAEEGAHPFVVLASVNGAGDRELVHLLERFPLTPVMILFPADAQAWDRPLINRSTEFAGWPCTEEELRYRLHRLAMKSCGAVCSSCTDPGDELLDVNIVGVSQLLRGAVRTIYKLARCDAPVLVAGETGTGKELAARGIHYNSSRRDAPFIPVNCGALPESLAENELFGHERGAYTHASGSQSGMVAQAEGGTLFLDEVHCLGPQTQAALLRFLEDGRYRPLGSGTDRFADVRVIAACNEDLATLAKQGRFRPDLFYRLEVLSLTLPALRERPEDIAPLAEHFLQLLRTQYQEPGKHLAPETLATLQRYRWPGNVRELDNRLHRAFVLADQAAIGPRDVFDDHVPPPESPHTLPGEPSFAGPFQQEKAAVIEAFERRYLQWVITEAQGNVSLAARRAGKERRALAKLLKKHGVHY